MSYALPFTIAAPKHEANTQNILKTQQSSCKRNKMIFFIVFNKTTHIKNRRKQRNPKMVTAHTFNSIMWNKYGIHETPHKKNENEHYENENQTNPHLMPMWTSCSHSNFLRVSLFRRLQLYASKNTAKGNLTNHCMVKPEYIYRNNSSDIFEISEMKW